MENRRKKIILVLALGVLSFGPMKGVFGNTLKWGYIDLKRAIESVEEGRKIGKELHAKKDLMVKDLKKEERKLIEASEKLKKQAGILSGEALNRKRQELTMMQLALQKKLNEAERELFTTQNEFVKDVLADMEKIIEEIGKGDGYEVIFEQSVSRILYATKKNDLTDRVIEIYNKQKKQRKSKKKQ